MNPVEEVLTTAFDSIAPFYDENFTFSNIGKFQRKRVYHFLEKVLPKNQSLEILEINCGTGEDAVWFAKKGHRVIATDASEKMIEESNSKFLPLQEGPNSKFRTCGFDKLKEEFSNNKFDLVFSNFGGLNCIDDAQLKKLSADLFSLLKPNGKFIAVIMGRKCLWEQFYFLCKLNFRKALRRLSKEGVYAAFGSQVQKTFYYSPAEFKKITGTEFRVTVKKPVGIAIPPSYLEPFFKNKTWLLKILNFKERLLSFSFLSNFADHYFIALQRRNNI
ncbi:MAG TPA: methyltransferase domain-containing protein [Bacteroidia bacterium]|nr:methyltransferase domain-containing protein [Bacteroidia bacterium]